jgi:FkbM family methyltransferase
VTPFWGALTSTGERLLLRVWAATAVAPGNCYQAINRYGRRYSGVARRSHLFTGPQMLCDLSDEIQRLVYFYGAFELIECHLLSRLAKPGWVAMDVGANVGCYTLLLASLVGSEGTVVAVEPITRNLEILRKNLAMNDFASRVTVVPQAVAERPGTLTLHLNEQDASENSTDYTQNIFGPLAHSEQVSVTTLDALAQSEQLRSVDFIKLDIEGGELRALQGASEVLRKFRPAILLEINPPHLEAAGYTLRELLSFLTDLDYEIWSIGTEGMSRLHVDAAAVRGNVMAFPRELEQAKKFYSWKSKAIIRELALKRVRAAVSARVAAIQGG